MYFLIWSIIRTVHITKDSGRYHGAIQSRIEIHLVIQVTDTPDLYLPKLTVPILFGLRHILIKVIMRSLSRQVSSCPFHAYSRKSRTQHYLFPIGRIKVETCHVCSTYGLAILYDGGSIYFGRPERFGKTGTEENTLSTCPTVREPISLYGA